MKLRIILITISALLTSFVLGQQITQLEILKKPKNNIRAKTSIGEERLKEIHKSFTKKKSPNSLNLKSSPAYMEKLDSIVVGSWNNTNNTWDDYFKEEYKYDTNGNLVQYLNSYSWISIDKIQYSYDDSGNLTEFISFKWDVEKKKYIGKEKEEYQYDINNNITQYVYWSRNRNDYLERSTKEEFTYDTYNNITLYIESRWNSATNTWIKHHKNEYKIQNDENKKINISYTWGETNQHWLNSFKTVDIFNENNRIAQMLQYSWNKEGENWVEAFKDVYEYDSNGNELLLHHHFEKDNNLSQWIDSYKVIQTYTEGNQTLFESYFWDKKNQMWIGDSKSESTYDSEQSVIKYIYQWDESENSWINHIKLEFSYDTNHTLIRFKSFLKRNEDWLLSESKTYITDSNANLEQFKSIKHRTDIHSPLIGYILKLTYDNTFSFNQLALPNSVPHLFKWGYNNTRLENREELYSNKLTEVMEYESYKDTSVWYKSLKYNFYYSKLDTPNSVNFNNATLSKISPNPVTDYITFNFTNNYDTVRFELFDIYGRKILDSKIQDNERLSLQHLNKGMYIYNLLINGYKQNGKLIKK